MMTILKNLQNDNLNSAADKCVNNLQKAMTIAGKQLNPHEIHYERDLRGLALGFSYIRISQHEEAQTV
jgi:hypothetical protein